MTAKCAKCGKVLRGRVFPDYAVLKEGTTLAFAVMMYCNTCKMYTHFASEMDIETMYAVRGDDLPKIRRVKA